MATSPLPSRGPKKERNCYVTPAFSGVPNAQSREKIRSGYLTPAFSGAQKQGGIAMEALHSRGSATPSAGRESEVATSPLRSRQPKKGQNCYVTHAFSGSPIPSAGRKSEVTDSPLPSRGPKKKCRVATSSLHSLGSPTPSAGRKSKLATSPLPSRGPRARRNCYVTPAFSGGDNAKRREKIRNGYVNCTF